MPSVSIKAFAGLRPISDPTLLSQAEAQSANNLKLVSGAISALLGTTTLKALTKTTPATIYRYGTDASESNYWLEFLTDTDVVASPIAADPWQRLYWADGSQAMMGVNTGIVSGSTYPGSSYILGIPAPASKPTISGTTPTAAAKSVTLTAIYTYVSAYGEEGPPSAAADVVSADTTQNITLSSMSSAPSGNYNITSKRIYLSSTVGNQAQFQFWKEVSVATTSVSGAYDQTALGEICPSTLWVAPPADIRGIKLMGNGAVIGFKDNTAYLSEPNLPHAWPHQYPIDYKIVGVGVFGQTAVLLTNGYPYLIYGADPQAMSTQKLSSPWACLSKRSIVDTGDGVIYASSEGLVMISSSGMDLLTKSLFRAEQWRDYNPSSMYAVLYNSRYHCFYTKADGTRGTLVFDFTGQGASLTTSDINTSTAVSAVFADPRTGTMYMAQGGNIIRFDRGSALTYKWRSKKFRAAYPMNFGYAQVVATTYPVTLNVYADGALKTSKSITSQEVTTLASGFRGLDWELELIGTSDVTQLNMATSVDEIKSL
jgi:hypothetical protein